MFGAAYSRIWLSQSYCHRRIERVCSILYLCGFSRFGEHSSCFLLFSCCEGKLGKATVISKRSSSCKRRVGPYNRTMFASIDTNKTGKSIFPYDSSITYSMVLPMIRNMYLRTLSWAGFENCTIQLITYQTSWYGINCSLMLGYIIYRFIQWLHHVNARFGAWLNCLFRCACSARRCT